VRILDHTTAAAYPGFMSDSGVERDLDDDFISAQSGDYEPEIDPFEDEDERSINDEFDDDLDDKFPDDARVVYLDDDDDLDDEFDDD